MKWLKWPCELLKNFVIGSDHEAVSKSVHNQVREAVHNVRNKATIAQAVSEKSVQTSERMERVAQNALNLIEKMRREQDS